MMFYEREKKKRETGIEVTESVRFVASELKAEVQIIYKRRGL